MCGERSIGFGKEWASAVYFSFDRDGGGVATGSSSDLSIFVTFSSG